MSESLHMDEFALNLAKLLTQFAVPQCAELASARQSGYCMELQNLLNKSSTRAETGRETSCSSCCHWAFKVLPFSAVTGQARLLLLVLSAAA